jgi:hypothetical protein
MRRNADRRTKTVANRPSTSPDDSPQNAKMSSRTASRHAYAWIDASTYSVIVGARPPTVACRIFTRNDDCNSKVFLKPQGTPGL